MTGRRQTAGSMTTAIAIGLCLIVAIPVLAGAAAAGLAATFGFGDSSALFGSSGAVTAPNRRPAASKPVPLDSDPLPLISPDLSWPWGQCTWYVAQHHRVTWGGNASDWLTNARAQGATTSSSPSVGAIAVFHKGAPYDADFGHVALVIGVTQGSYSVVEMHYVGLGRIDARTIPRPDPYVEGFIL